MDCLLTYIKGESAEDIALCPRDSTEKLAAQGRSYLHFDSSVCTLQVTDQVRNVFLICILQMVKWCGPTNMGALQLLVSN